MRFELVGERRAVDHADWPSSFLVLRQIDDALLSGIFGRRRSDVSSCAAQRDNPLFEELPGVARSFEAALHGHWMKSCAQALAMRCDIAGSGLRRNVDEARSA